MRTGSSRRSKSGRSPLWTDTTVIQITPDHKVYAAHEDGMVMVQARAIVLAMGCRERTRGVLAIPGTRPRRGADSRCGPGLHQSAESYAREGKSSSWGSGDIGLIMARRLTLEGAHVKGGL